MHQEEIPGKPVVKKGKKKSNQKSVELGLDIERPDDQDRMAEEFREEMTQLQLVRSRPDLKARIDELFEKHVRDEPEVKGAQKLDYYFDSYSHYGIHEEMLQDNVRTKAYELSMIRNPELFKDKIVLDVGCGTGVLSMFAVRAGAKHVYAIEKANIHHKASEIIKLNGYGNSITVINGKVEEIELPVPKVDIIISEWMGYALLYEGMFDSVIYARDKWLAKGGMLFPDRALAYVKGIDDHNFWRDKLDFWNSVYGFKYETFKKWIELEPLVEVCPKNIMVTEDCAVLDINLMTVTLEQLDFASEYSLTAKLDTYVNGIVMWFDVIFSFGKTPIKLTTNPEYQATHWKQVIMYLKEDVPLKKGEQVKGTFLVKKNAKNPRDLDIKVSYHANGELGTVDGQQYYLFA